MSSVRFGDGIDVVVSPALPAPTDAGAITENPVVFEWVDPNAGSLPITSVALEVGTAVGGSDVFSSEMTGTSSLAVPGVRGEVLYARLVVTDPDGYVLHPAPLLRAAW